MTMGISWWSHHWCYWPWKGYNTWNNYEVLKCDKVIWQQSFSSNSSKRSVIGLLSGVLHNYQLVMNWLLWKVADCHTLKTRPLKDKPFAQVCSIGESCQNFKSLPYLTSHVTRIEKKNLKLKRHLNLKI